MKLKPPVTYHWPSPAKLNLFLYINARRPDGYHELQTLFQFIDYGDQLSIAINNNRHIELLADIKGITTKQNLIWQAIQSLLPYAQSTAGATIKLTKKLPIGGGLGGGSSNAATVLVALNTLWQLNLSIELLMEIGLSIGADVPVFIQGNAAFAQGVGERLSPVILPEHWFLIVVPECQVNTKALFNHENLIRSTAKRPLAELLTIPWSNDCQPTAIAMYSEIENALNWLLQYAPARMTGAGSCLFAQFLDKKTATAPLTQLPAGMHAFVAQGKNCSPLLIKQQTMNYS